MQIEIVHTVSQLSCTFEWFIVQTVRWSKIKSKILLSQEKLDKIYPGYEYMSWVIEKLKIWKFICYPIAKWEYCYAQCKMHSSFTLKNHSNL